MIHCHKNANKLIFSSREINMYGYETFCPVQVTWDYAYDTHLLNNVNDNLPLRRIFFAKNTIEHKHK